jgi:Putative peptidoglycan binding domain
MKNSKLVIFLSCLFAATFTAPVVTAAAHGGGFSGGHSFAGRPGMGMLGRPGMGMPGRPGMGMPGRPGVGMRSGGNRLGGDLHDHHDHFNHHEHEDIDVIFIGSFGFPWWWGWGWGPWWGWGYPYGYYGYGDPYGYGYGYGQYGDASHSRVAELQRRLARAGYYHGTIDGILGPQTRRAIRAYERDHAYAG